MKSAALCVVAVVLGAAGVFAHPEELSRTFNEANRLYLEQKYDSAVVKYESIVRNGYESGDLFYNIGNAYYKAGKIQYAILNYERAKKMMPDDDDLHFNLQLANLHITDKVDPVPELFIYRWFNTVLSLVPPATMIWIMYGLFVTALGAFSWFMVSDRYLWKRYALVIGIAGSIVLVLGIATMAIRSYKSAESVYAVVTSDVANIKAAPDSAGNDLFVIHSGLKVQVLDEVNNWQKIRLADGKIGWIQKSELENI